MIRHPGRGAAILGGRLIRCPTDLFALVLGHRLDFFLGDARGLRHRVGRLLAL